MSKINNIAVVGAGTMGLGIAQVCALSGYVVKLFDLNEKSLQTAEQKINVNLNKGIEKGKISKQQKSEGLKNLNFTHNFNDLKADLFIEAVVEKLEVKIQLFNQLMENNGDTAIYASNTSSIPLSQIAGKCKFPEKVIGIHFFNPAHIMKLVEIIKPAQADKALIRNTKSFVKSIGKVPILVQDSPGFVVNRVARHFYVESLKVLEDGVADLTTIDALIKNMGFKMGPFELMDLIGVEANYNVTKTMFEQFNFDAKFRPSRIQKAKVDAGLWGRKTGKGFYEYDK
ncbi:MAG: 3-hydroxybutyryl-CoA dehydrogenase [Bacteroidetes bacterium MED-G17]|nr:MAG: 3-hydroxybutyryl-CoA dehydrogenase [Bacteroidetes bacterium MED-G17]CAI8358527.1 MAG: 3-hydroxyadipyl-CoA dehydrogenase [Bacteroidetes bacterium MED-G17]|tara:strand:+ start:4824 stop:5678 length:855 start_codon:yes stop_codon:yes gene_type:complete